MISGLKSIEYRRSSNWIKQRLHNKEYTYIKFVNGCGNDKPYFICKYNGYTISKEKKQIDVNGNTINIEKGHYLIRLGEITEKGNI